MQTKPMQKDRIRITNPETARALRNTAVLHYFLEPTSPSDVAKKSGLAANLVHHHAKKAFDLGILLESKRENGKVFYQLAAKEFSHARNLVPIEHKEAEDLQLISNAFLEAYIRSDALGNNTDPDYTLYGFAKAGEDPAPPPQQEKNESLEKHPAHFHARTARLSKQRYEKLIRDITALINEAKSEGSSEAGICSIVALGFDGTWLESREDTTMLNSFVPSKK